MGEERISRLKFPYRMSWLFRSEFRSSDDECDARQIFDILIVINFHFVTRVLKNNAVERIECVFNIGVLVKFYL